MFVFCHDDLGFLPRGFCFIASLILDWSRSNGFSLLLRFWFSSAYFFSASRFGYGAFFLPAGVGFVKMFLPF
jgi:hypothetical protein